MAKTCPGCGHALSHKAARRGAGLCATCTKFAAGRGPDRAPLTYDDQYPGVATGASDSPAFADFVAHGHEDGVSVAEYWRRLRAATDLPGD